MQAYNKLILSETQIEKGLRTKVENDANMTEEAKARELIRIEEKCYYRRIINSLYFKQLRALILSKEYS